MSTTETSQGTYTTSKGIAGQISVTRTESVPEAGGWPKGATVCTSFVGSTHGGPVVYVSPGGAQSFVTDPGRFGEFDDDPIRWARRFFSDES